MQKDVQIGPIDEGRICRGFILWGVRTTCTTSTRFHSTASLSRLSGLHCARSLITALSKCKSSSAVWIWLSEKEVTRPDCSFATAMRFSKVSSFLYRSLNLSGINPWW